MSTTGFYWRINACLNAPKQEEEHAEGQATTESDGCADDLLVYAVHEAQPEFRSVGDGYFGFSPSRGIGGSKKMNMLE